MTRLEKSFKIFSKQGVKFLLLELVVVFLGVYLAFLFQSYSEDQKLEIEKEKIMIGLKEDFEYFRIFFPDYAGQPQVQIWREMLQKGNYIDFSSWRFIQPQHDYIAIEYALDADAEVIDFETNSSIANIYQELKKLEHVEIILNDLALKYQKIPEINSDDIRIKIAHENNLLNFKRFTERYADRAGIMIRIAELCGKQLPIINNNFGKEKLAEIELLLISKNITVNDDQEVQFYVNILKQFFPNLSEEEITKALDSN
ncbi:MAG: hypothetical protein ROO71_01180 [Balneola sp.]